MKVFIEAARQDLTPYINTLYKYQFKEVYERDNTKQHVVEAGYITLADMASLSLFVEEMNKYFGNNTSKFVLSTTNNELSLLIYDDWIE